MGNKLLYTSAYSYISAPGMSYEDNVLKIDVPSVTVKSIIFSKYSLYATRNKGIHLLTSTLNNLEDFPFAVQQLILNTWEDAKTKEKFKIFISCRDYTIVMVKRDNVLLINESLWKQYFTLAFRKKMMSNFVIVSAPTLPKYEMDVFETVTEENSFIDMIKERILTI